MASHRFSMNDLIQPNLGCAIQKMNSTHLIQQAFKSANEFFSCENDYKVRYQSNERDYGYHALPDKELFILCDDQVPEPLLPCLDYFNWIHDVAKSYLIKLAHHLDLLPERFLSLICDSPIDKRTKSSTILRLIHYYADTDRNSEFASAAHQDIGLLTIIPKTAVPALEVYDFTDAGEWLAIEDSLSEDELLILVGETLSKITNHYFLANAHRVINTHSSRISIAYQLRAKPNALLNSSSFETSVTGKFHRPFLMTADE